MSIDKPPARPGWETYDPGWLVALAEAQYPDEPWLAEALRACTRARPESRAYVHFVDPRGPIWRFAGNLMLQSREHGTLILDILEGQVVGGVELLDRL
jgi:hypothetical protein